jgi:hypothetical protein
LAIWPARAFTRKALGEHLAPVMASDQADARADRADDERHIVDGDQLLGLLARDLRIGFRVFLHELDLVTEDATGGVDLFGRDLERPGLLLAELRVGPRVGGQDADLEDVLCGGGVRRQCDSGRCRQ